MFPFGAMRLSPDTTLGANPYSTFWDNYGGYYYKDHFVEGFSHTHMQGAGVADLQNFLVTVTRMMNKKVINNRGYMSYHTHASEVPFFD